MPYILSIAIVAVAIVPAAVFAVRARETEVRAASAGPTGRPRAGGPASGTANERVGQG
jgi:hypothetical protein